MNRSIFAVMAAGLMMTSAPTESDAAVTFPLVLEGHFVLELGEATEVSVILNDDGTGIASAPAYSPIDIEVEWEFFGTHITAISTSIFLPIATIEATRIGKCFLGTFDVAALPGIADANNGPMHVCK